jgi:DNA-binding transcriptional regulator PaaX
MLARGNGATIAELIKATGWKEHSCRAFLTGVRKKATLHKEQRSDGKTAYHLETQPAEKVPE